MQTDERIVELQRAYRNSARAIPIYAVMFAVCGVAFWIARMLVTVPTWLIIVVLGMTGVVIVGDVINLFYCRWKLETWKHEQQS
jgi:hypothetical protein